MLQYSAELFLDHKTQNSRSELRNIQLPKHKNTIKTLFLKDIKWPKWLHLFSEIFSNDFLIILSLQFSPNYVTCLHKEICILKTPQNCIFFKVIRPCYINNNIRNHLLRMFNDSVHGYTMEQATQKGIVILSWFFITIYREASLTESDRNVDFFFKFFRKICRPGLEMLIF